MGNVVALITEALPEEWTTFENFWLVWPRREAKKDAQRAWNGIEEADKQSALLALIDWRRVWANKETQYIPLPASWLRAERWTDEVPKEFRNSREAATRTLIAEQSKTTRVAPPPEFLALLEKMRGKR
jgi:hypothetical protein